MQFNPLLDKKDQIWVFVNDLSRCGPFDYARTDDTYPHLKNLIYVLSEELMFNQTRNPDNANYFGLVDGTSNLTTTLKAPGFVSKGHFY